MTYYHKMTNQEVLRLQTALGTFRANFGPSGVEVGIFFGCLGFASFDGLQYQEPYLLGGVVIVIISRVLYRYLMRVRAKKQAIRQDLIQLEKELIEVKLQYKTIDEQTDRYNLILEGSGRSIPVDRQTYDALQPGQCVRLSLSRFARIVVSYEKLT